MSSLWVTPEELGDFATSEYAYEAAKTASFLLWGLSGRKWSGLLETTEVYSASHEHMSLREYLQFPELSFYVSKSRYDESTKLKLRGTPLISIVSVTINNLVIAPADYEIIDHSILKFNYKIESDIIVRYRYGTRPPVAGQMAARTLAIEFAKLWSGNDDCALPSRVTSVSRQGVTFTILDNQDFIAELRTGIYAVDLFLKTVNPDKARKRAKVFSPDIPRGRRKIT